AQSGETNQDSEPNIAVNPANPAQIAGSAFTPSQGFCRTNLAPIFVSSDGGDTWALNCIVPSDSSGMTSDITVRFAETNLYAGIQLDCCRGACDGRSGWPADPTRRAFRWHHLCRVLSLDKPRR